MPNFKGIINYSHPRGGWSQTYYKQSASLATAAVDFRSLADGLNTIIAPPTQITTIRVSGEDAPKVFRKFLYGIAPSQAWDSTSDTPWQAFLVDLYGNVSPQRPLFLRGVADNAIINSGEALAGDGATFQGNYFNFVQAPLILPANGYYIKGKSQVTTAVAITDFGASANIGVADVKIGFNVGTNVPGTLPAVNSLVTIYRLVGANRRPGLTRVLGVDAASNSFSIGFHVPAGFSYTAGAFFRPYVAVPNNIVDAQIQGVTHRIVGKPSGLQRGARPRIRK